MTNLAELEKPMREMSDEDLLQVQIEHEALKWETQKRSYQMLVALCRHFGVPTGYEKK